MVIFYTSINTMIKSIQKYSRYFLDAVKGTEKNFTSGNINKAIFMLSIPMILEMIMESIFAVVDIYFVGKISVNAVATVALTESVIMIIYAIAMGMSMAATALVARRVGENKPEEASKTAVQAIILAGAIAIAFALVGIFFPKEILSLMGGAPDLVEEGYRYTMIMVGGNLSVMLLFVINAIFRGAGDASISMRSLILANSINIVLDPLFIFGLGPWDGFGLEGAAIATTAGRGIGVMFQLYVLFKGSSMIKVAWANFKVRLEIILSLIKLSLGGIGQMMIGTLSWLFLVRISAEFGSDVLAGYAIAFRIIMFTILPSWGLANAAATLVGQNLGAGEPDRAEKSVWQSALFNVIFLGIVAVVFFSFAEYFVSLFTQEPSVIEVGAIALRYISFGYVFFAYGMVIGQAFNGAGDTKTPTVMNFFCFWLFEVPLAYVLAVHLEFGPKGIFAAIAIASSLWAVVSIIIFRRGNWKTVKI
jgi:putative MATE family efflux protein